MRQNSATGWLWSGVFSRSGERIITRLFVRIDRVARGSGNSINSVDSGSYPSGNSGNVVASAGVAAPSSDITSNTGGACSTPNGQGTCVSMSGGCSGGSFVPGYCSATSEEVRLTIPEQLDSHRVSEY